VVDRRAGDSESFRYDWLIRANFGRFARDLAAWLLGEPPLETVAIESGLAVASARFADKILDVRFRGRPSVLLHVEFQVGGDPDMPERMAEYLALVLGVLKSPEHKGKRFAAAVVYLDRKTYREDPGSLEIEGELGLRFSIHYQVVKLWEVDPAPILAMESPGLCPFVPLMRGNPLDLLVQSKERILRTSEERAGFEAKKDLLAVLAGLATRVVADRDALARTVREIRAMGENFVFDLLFQEGKEAGLREGLEKGLEKGQVAEARAAILRILKRRFGSVGPEAAARLEAIPRLDLETLVEDAAVAPTLEDFLRRLSCFERGARQAE
jgi:predicted transposase YdaD